MNRIVTPILVALILVGALVTCASAEPLLCNGKSPCSDLNSELSLMLSRMHVVTSTGGDQKTGQYPVKVLAWPRGEECDVPGSKLCEGIDLLITVRSLDLAGDTAVHRVSGLGEWEFREWKSYAEHDSPEDFTAFEVLVKAVNRTALPKCQNSVDADEAVLIIHVNPWKIWCEYKGV